MIAMSRRGRGSVRHGWLRRGEYERDSQLSDLVAMQNASILQDCHSGMVMYLLLICERVNRIPGAIFASSRVSSSMGPLSGVLYGVRVDGALSTLLLCFRGS